MRNHYYSNGQRKPFRPVKGFFPVDPRHLERARKANHLADSALKAILWFGYGVAMVGWFLAVNAVILFSQMMKIK